MSIPSHSLNAYRQISREDESTDRLVLLGLEGVSEYIRRARVAIRDHDVRAKARAMERAYQIVSHLLVSMDEAQGGKIAKKLDGLYRLLLLKLAHANIFDDLQSLEDCRPIVKNLSDVWQGLLNG